MIAEAMAAVAASDVVILSLGLGNDIEGEGRDRSELTFPAPQRALLSAVKNAVKTKNTKTTGWSAVLNDYMNPAMLIVVG